MQTNCCEKEKLNTNKNFENSTMCVSRIARCEDKISEKKHVESEETWLIQFEIVLI